MPLPDNTPLLLIDGASPRCFVGLWQDGDWLATVPSEVTALEGIFAGIEQILCEAKMTLNEVGGFIHNEGPGSILGIRLSAMAIRTWLALPQWRETPVWTFGSLHFVAAAYQTDHECCSVNVISEFRHKRWNLLTTDAEQVIAVTGDELANVPAPLIYQRQRKSWEPAPEHAIEWTPDWSKHAATLNSPGLLRLVENPEVFVTEEAEFKKWSAERHR